MIEKLDFIDVESFAELDWENIDSRDCRYWRAFDKALYEREKLANVALGYSSYFEKLTTGEALSLNYEVSSYDSSLLSLLNARILKIANAKVFLAIGFNDAIVDENGFPFVYTSMCYSGNQRQTPFLSYEMICSLTNIDVFPSCKSDEQFHIPIDNFVDWMKRFYNALQLLRYYDLTGINRSYSHWTSWYNTETTSMTDAYNSMTKKREKIDEGKPYGRIFLEKKIQRRDYDDEDVISYTLGQDVISPELSLQREPVLSTEVSAFYYTLNYSFLHIPNEKTDFFTSGLLSAGFTYIGAYTPSGDETYPTTIPTGLFSQESFPDVEVPSTYDSNYKSCGCMITGFLVQDVSPSYSFFAEVPLSSYNTLQ